MALFAPYRAFRALGVVQWLGRGFCGCMGLVRLLVGFWVLGVCRVACGLPGGGVCGSGPFKPGIGIVMVMGGLLNFSLPLIYAEKF